MVLWTDKNSPGDYLYTLTVRGLTPRTLPECRGLQHHDHPAGLLPKWQTLTKPHYVSHRVVAHNKKSNKIKISTAGVKKLNTAFACSPSHFQCLYLSWCSYYISQQACFTIGHIRPWWMQPDATRHYGKRAKYILLSDGKGLHIFCSQSVRK